MLRKAGLVVALVLVLTLALPTVAYGQGSEGPKEKWCSGVKIVFFPGGPRAASSPNVYNGAVRRRATWR